jgi:hypothetical protein
LLLLVLDGLGGSSLFAPLSVGWWIAFFCWQWVADALVGCLWLPFPVDGSGGLSLVVSGGASSRHQGTQELVMVDNTSSIA